MQTRKLGFTDLYISEIGFGAWAVGGGGYAFGWGDQNDAESIAAIRRAVELGVNWIDTAAIYGLGHSETVVGKAIRGLRDDIIIATKCSRRWTDKREVYGDLTREGIKFECEQSLKRLGIERIDLYQIHWIDPDAKGVYEEAWAAIGELMDEGKVRYGGVSNFDASEMSKAQAIHPIASLQPPYSMLRRDVEGDVFDFCRDNRVGVVAYSPMQAGLLTGRFDINRVHPDDWRRRSLEFKEPNLSINLWFAGELGRIADKYGKTTAQLALAWVLRLDMVTSAIAGARRPAQIEETVGGSGWKIDDSDLQKIDDLLDERARRVESAGGTVRR